MFPSDQGTRDHKIFFGLARGRLEEDIVSVSEYVRKMDKMDWELSTLKGIIDAKQISIDG